MLGFLSIPQPQSSPCSLGALALLVSVDSLRSLLPLANATLWHRFLRSPPKKPPGSPLPGQRVFSHTYCSTRGNELQAKISTLASRVLIHRIKQKCTIPEFTQRREQTQRKMSFYQSAFFFVFFKHFQYAGPNFLRIPFVLVTEALQPFRCK